MKNKKLSLILLINLIIIFIVLCIFYLSSISNNNGDMEAVKNKVIELNDEVDDMQVKIENWEQEKSVDIKNQNKGNKDDQNDDEDQNDDQKQDKEDDDDEQGDDTEKEDKEDDEDKQDKKQDYTVSTSSNLNVRSEPSTNGSVVKKLTSGAEVSGTGNTKEADGHTWKEIKLDSGKTVWAAGEFLE